MRTRLEPGQIIDGFRLEERLHRGGMAVVWRVTHAEHTGMPLAMKIPLFGYDEGAGPIVGFEVEQMILPRVHGRHVPKFIAQAGFETQPYIVMELIEGASLLPLIDKAPLETAQVVDIGCKVATALHDLHSQHVIHFDVKPSNVMFRGSGEAVLIDFGFARHDRLPDLLSEETHLPVGTAPYISPEQVLGDRTDLRSDIFALGVMLYLFATGQRPFGNPTRTAALRRRLWRDPIPPRRLNENISPPLQELILGCLEVDADKRPQTAAQLAFDLAHLDQIRLTARSQRMARDSLMEVVRRRFQARKLARPKQAGRVASHLGTGPIIMVAVDLAPEMEEIAERLREVVVYFLQAEPKARLACVNVLRTARLTIDFGEDQQGRNLHVQRLIELRHWGHPLALHEDRVTYSVLEATDAASALLQYAENARVEHIVVGARASSSLRRYLGSVSSQIVAEAKCSVTVVRTRFSDSAQE